MQARNKILAVDDDICSLGLIDVALNDKYDVVCETSGREGMLQAEKQKPDLILLDIQMPEIDGYEICRQLKSNDATKDIPVTFVSAKESIEERMTGYEAGADDYITKPFHESELLKKVEINLRNKTKLTEIGEELDFTRNTAMVAMSSSGELGLIINFLSRSFYCNTLENLAQEIIEIMSGYSLNCSVQLRTSCQVVTHNSSGVVKPLEASLLEKLTNADRITDFGKRTFVNFPYCTLLVKNMPLEDEQRYGRMKDNIALLVEGANARVQALEASLEVERQKAKLTSLISESRRTLTDIDEENSQNRLKNTRILDDLTMDIEEAFIKLGLDEGQEKFIIDRINRAQEEADALYQNGIELDKRLGDITSSLKGD